MNDEEFPSVLSFVERLSISYTNVVRIMYRYLTGDGECIGFVRWMFLLTAITKGAVSVLAYNAGQLKDAGFSLGGVVLIMVLAGPQTFREAALAGAGPLPHNWTTRATLIGLSMITPFAVYATLVAPSGQVQKLLELLGWATLMAALWATSSRRPNGRRTLVGDVRQRLLPAAAPPDALGTEARATHGISGRLPKTANTEALAGGYEEHWAPPT